LNFFVLFGYDRRSGLVKNITQIARQFSNSMIISIAGLHGTGKSTIAKLIADRFGFKYYSTGMLFRAKAKDLNISLVEFSKLAEKDETIDRDLDRRIVEMAEEGGNYVFEGQLPTYMLGQLKDLAIHFRCQESVRIRRMAARDDQDINAQTKETLHREQSERQRFIQLYGIDVMDIARRHVQAASTAVEMAELLTRLADRGRINDGQHLFQVIEEQSVIKGFVAILEREHIDVFLQVAGFDGIAFIGPLLLQAEISHAVGQQTAKAQPVPFVFRESGALVVHGVLAEELSFKRHLNVLFASEGVGAFRIDQHSRSLI